MFNFLKSISNFFTVNTDATPMQENGVLDILGKNFGETVQDQQNSFFSSDNDFGSSSGGGFGSDF